MSALLRPAARFVGQRTVSVQVLTGVQLSSRYCVLTTSHPSECRSVLPSAGEHMHTVSFHVHLEIIMYVSVLTPPAQFLQVEHELPRGRCEYVGRGNKSD